MNRKSGQQAGFKDHFSGHADAYARYRPAYPPALFDWLADRAPGRGLAWDAACGNGQAAVALAGRFGRVVASDASVPQIAAAGPHPSVSYLVARAEASSLASGTVDLVTVAQAAHWFDMPAFAAEAGRVLRPGGVVAAWCYALTRIDPPIDAVIRRFYADTLGDYWPPERRFIEGGYRDLPFPFDELDAPDFHMSVNWSLAEFLGYLGTWSAYRRFVAERKHDPLPSVAEALEPLWGGRAREVRWPVHLRVGVVERT